MSEITSILSTPSAYFSIEQDLLKGSKVATGFAVGGRFLAIKNNPVGGSRILLMTVHPRDKRDVTLPFGEASSQGEEALKRFVAQHYSGAA